MKTIQISYDLMTPGQNYTRVIAYIKSHGIWANPLKSCWLIKTNRTATQVRDEVLAFIDVNDKVLVTDMTGVAWASYGMDADVARWLQAHMNGGPTHPLVTR